MGSGCSKNSNSFGKCFTTLPSNCVQWSGDPIPLLDICTNDTVTEVMQVVIEKLLIAMDGTGIDLTELDADCDFISNQLAGIDYTLFNIIQVLINSSCTLKELVDEVTTQVNLPVTYDPKCLGAGTYTTQSLLQAAVNELCTLKTQVDNLTSQVNSQPLESVIKSTTGNWLQSIMTSEQKNLAGVTHGGSNYGVTFSGSGDSTTISFYGFVPPFCPIFCYAPLSNFDSSGRGMEGTPFRDYFIMNGLNNTVDFRGYTPAGATNLPGINGPALQTVVDPTVQSDITIGANILERKGSPKVILSTPNLPAHTHPGSANAHHHGIKLGGHFNVAGSAEGPDVPSYSASEGMATEDASLTITVGSTGDGTAHENRQPTIYGYFITRLF